jgi:hypothetical protein
MFKYTRHSLKKIEQILEETGYSIRYERGNFHSGYCIVENKNIAVVNKFFDTEARITCLIEILNKIEIDEKRLSDKSIEFYKKINKSLSKSLPINQGLFETEKAE